ncbi:type II toxin-antitoxin system VapC family toxin [Candidatus Leptofilum sp.]|uniref:type II toxin-antitoxin system VapC family toxin n=1 Tax=Candidatus Leptofilum sp. TaxID=3241576 RepID=UPI003B5A4E65
MNLFVDSSGWIALFGDRDKFHQRAVDAYRSLKNQRLNLLTTDYVFDETVTFLQKHYGTVVAQKCGEAILNTPYINLLYLDNEVWQAAWEMFQAYADKQWAFTDCTSFIVMQQQLIWQAFSFDQHFVQAGFQLWPGNE